MSQLFMLFVCSVNMLRNEEELIFQTHNKITRQSFHQDSLPAIIRNLMGSRNLLLLFLILVLLYCGYSSAFAFTSPPAKIIGGLVSNVLSGFVKWLWSLKLTAKTKPATSQHSLVKFESGYNVETLFDETNLDIETHSIEVLPSGGELLLLDSVNSNIFKISTTSSPYNKPKLVAGSLEGYSGHVDGKPRESRMNHPKGFAVDDRGNIYVADTMNMAIRKISDAGVTTIAGGKWGRGGHIDGPSEDAKLSSDFDVIYVGSSCSLLVVDRGNRAIREIQLYEDDCNKSYDPSFHLGIAVFVAAAFFGYMFALLHWRVKAIFSSPDDEQASMKNGITRQSVPYRSSHVSVRPPLIPTRDESVKPVEGFFQSVTKIIGGIFFGSKKKAHQQQWPMQESFVFGQRDKPPPALDTKAFRTSKKSHQFRQTRNLYSGCNYNQHKQQSNFPEKQFFSSPQSYDEKSCDSGTNGFVFGAVQELDGRREAVVIKAMDYREPVYSHHNVRPRLNHMGYSHHY